MYILYPIIAALLVQYKYIDHVSQSGNYLIAFQVINSAAQIVPQFLMLNYWDNMARYIGKRYMLTIGILMCTCSYVIFGFSFNLELLLLSKFIMAFNSNITITRIFVLELIERDRDRDRDHDDEIGNGAGNGEHFLKYASMLSVSWQIGALVGSNMSGYFYGNPPGVLNYNQYFTEYPLLFVSIISLCIGTAILIYNIIAHVTFEINTRISNAPFSTVGTTSIHMERQEYAEDIKVLDILKNFDTLCLIMSHSIFVSIYMCFVEMLKLYLLSPDANGGFEYTPIMISGMIGISYIISLITDAIFNLICFRLINIPHKIVYYIITCIMMVIVCCIPFIQYITSNIIGNFCLMTWLCSIYITCNTINNDSTTQSILYVRNKNKVGTIFGLVQSFICAFNAILLAIYITIYQQCMQNYVRDFVDAKIVFAVIALSYFLPILGVFWYRR